MPDLLLRGCLHGLPAIAWPPACYCLLQRIGAGYVLSCLSMVVAACMEVRRLALVRADHLQDSPKAQVCGGGGGGGGRKGRGWRGGRGAELGQGGYPQLRGRRGCRGGGVCTQKGERGGKGRGCVGFWEGYSRYVCGRGVVQARLCVLTWVYMCVCDCVSGVLMAACLPLPGWAPSLPPCTPWTLRPLH